MNNSNSNSTAAIQLSQVRVRLDELARCSDPTVGIVVELSLTNGLLYREILAASSSVLPDIVRSRARDAQSLIRDNRVLCAALEQVRG